MRQHSPAAAGAQEASAVGCPQPASPRRLAGWRPHVGCAALFEVHLRWALLVGAARHHHPVAGRVYQAGFTLHVRRRGFLVAIQLDPHPNGEPTGLEGSGGEGQPTRSGHRCNGCLPRQFVSRRELIRPSGDTGDMSLRPACTAASQMHACPPPAAERRGLLRYVQYRHCNLHHMLNGIDAGRVRDGLPAGEGRRRACWALGRAAGGRRALQHPRACRLRPCSASCSGIARQAAALCAAMPPAPLVCLPAQCDPNCMTFSTAAGTCCTTWYASSCAGVAALQLMPATHG